ncbi:mitochondrial PGP phosphatase-domain-containing protein [Coprinopsis sp. MPI-PUGE-AT-0042]|nr:mitochondrial PGP phosphatase-domain-containing protein [Coprinopsis sp. MPI-PUGE-AT-0042]
MPLNIPGLLAPFQLVIYPRLVLPHISVKDIRHLDFRALKKAGYRGAVFDKDNCLTIPYKDTLVPELTDAWRECLDTFGDGNVIIVSNSAGTYLDAGGIQAESVSHHLGVPVLVHDAFKPAYSCITAIRTYFASLQRPIREHELIIVGDRIFTDIIMANRIRRASERKQNALLPVNIPGTGSGDMPPTEPAGPLGVWTTGLWKKEALVMRYLEASLVKAVDRWSTGPSFDASRYVKEPPAPLEVKKSHWASRLLSRFRT